MKDEVEKILEYFRSPVRSDSLVTDQVRINEATTALLTLFQTAQVEAVRAALEAVNKPKYLNAAGMEYLIDRLANLKEDGEKE